MKSLDVPIYLFDKSAAEKRLDEQLEKGPDVHPLAEMAEDEVEHALFDDDGEEEKKEISPPKPKKNAPKSKKKKK